MVQAAQVSLLALINGSSVSQGQDMWLGVMNLYESCCGFNLIVL
jgi:hypothetical protein